MPAATGLDGAIWNRPKRSRGCVYARTVQQVGRPGPVLAYLDAVGSYPPYVCILLVQVIMYV